MNNIYLNYHHSNDIVTYQNKKWYHKSVKNKKIQRREFVIQHFLYKTGHLPKCIKYTENGFFEEFIIGKTFSKFNSIDNSMLGKLANALQCIHQFSVHRNYKKFFSKNTNSIYRAQKVYELVKGAFDVGILRIDIAVIQSIIDVVNSKIKNLKYKLTVIHGDINPNNIFITPSRGLVIIDWTDCRVDVGICDVSQAIHSLRLNEEQKKYFLNNYNDSLNFPELIQFQQIMHCLYDVIAKIITKYDYSTELKYLSQCLSQTKKLLR